MQPQEPIINDPGDVPGQTPQQEIIGDPDLPSETPVDDVYDPVTEGPDVVDRSVTARASARAGGRRWGALRPA